MLVFTSILQLPEVLYMFMQSCFSPLYRPEDHLRAFLFPNRVEGVFFVRDAETAQSGPS